MDFLVNENKSVCLYIFTLINKNLNESSPITNPPIAKRKKVPATWTGIQTV